MSTNMPPPSEPFHAVWLNINGINSNKANSSFHLLINSFMKSKYSIMFLQEPRLKGGKAGGQIPKNCSKIGKSCEVGSEQNDNEPYIPFNPNAWGCEGRRPMHKNATIVEGIWRGAEKMQKWRFKPSKKTLPLLGIWP